MNYFNRELSWIDFNRRVLAEGLREDLPPLERFRFLSIVSSNFDEFFMVRVAALKRNPDAETEALLGEISKNTRSIFSDLYSCLDGVLFPLLERWGLEFRRPPWSEADRGYLKVLFYREILPVLTPLRLAEDLPPLIANGVLYGAFLLGGDESGDRTAIVQIPPVLDRIIPLPNNNAVGVRPWALLDDLLRIWGGALFPGYEVKENMIFRVHRDADFSVDERRDEDFIEAMNEVLAGREHSSAVRLVYNPGSGTITEQLTRILNLAPEDLYKIDGPLNLSSLWSLMQVRDFDELKAKSRRCFSHPAFSGEGSVWDAIRAGDILLTVPYHSFDPVVRFFQEAAADPQVLSIKTALYRTSGNSPIIRALEQAALGGKHVTAVVELKARFDEERNISWAKRLEDSGVIVIYGLSRLKVHAKISQVIRRESGGMCRYIHLATGNYNDKTARLYSDISLFTCREEFGADATAVFNMLSGYSSSMRLERLVMAPQGLKTRFLELIGREADRAKSGAPGKIIAKMNALLDKEIIDALYAASCCGVKILLNVRGICTLVPGVQGMSENITVISIIDHFLEHSRIYFFGNGGLGEYYISSAVLMPRNLERRVELLIPIVDSAVQAEVQDILNCYFADNTQAWILGSDGEWTRTRGGGKAFSAQEYLLRRAEKMALSGGARNDFVVRRSPPGVQP